MNSQSKWLVTKDGKPTEYAECVAFVEYLEILKKQKRIQLFTHVPNETFTRVWATKLKNKKMGVRPGFPDYIVLTNKEIYFIEMKIKSGGEISKSQKEWIEALTILGYKNKVCRGFDSAKEFIEENI